MAKKSNSRGAALASQLRAQVAKAKPQTASVRLAIPEIAPDFVFEFEAKRIPIQSWLMSGFLPESMARMILSVRTPEAFERIEDDAAAAVDEMSVDEQIALIEFQKKVATEVCVSPKLVYRDATAEDEIDLRDPAFADIADKLIKALYAYAMGLSPAVPVATTTGEDTTVEAVETFPEKPEFPNAGKPGATVRPAA